MSQQSVFLSYQSAVMKMFLTLIILVMGMALAGWLTFSQSKDEVSVTINKQEVKQDTRKAAEAGSEVLDQLTD